MHGTSRQALTRLRVRAWPILQTAVAAVAAWYLARLLLPERQPVFASIAAVVALGATYGQRSERALELIGGVVLGIGVADLLVRALGNGSAQIGVMVLLAMSAAVLLGGGPLLVTEAAVSAILLVVLEPTSAGLASSRVVEALIGGGVALAVSALAFPPDPLLLVRRSAQAVFSSLGRTLDELAAALPGRDVARAEAALAAAREIDGSVRELDEALALGRETARLSVGRRSSHPELDRQPRRPSRPRKRTTGARRRIVVEHQRKQAKALVRAYHAGDPEARARAEAALGARAAERFLLSDAQHVVAREGGYGTWREGPPLPSFSTPSGPSSFIRGQAELEYGRLAEGTLWIGNGFDATLPGTTKPNGRSYVLVPSSPLPLSF